jgi:asparaginyl-tRNA synthetase
MIETLNNAHGHGHGPEPLGHLALRSPNSWNDDKDHFEQALCSPWYREIGALVATFVGATHRFFEEEGVFPALMPITCQSVSSPMGLGSDSLPVDVDLFGKKTYLADSMQFQLEYMLRQGIPGAWYIMPTFRGEEPDSRHLNQFFHSEAEIVGGFEDVLVLVERYIRYLSKAVLQHHADRLKSIGTEHIEALVENSKFPRLGHDEALEMLASDERFTSRVNGCAERTITAVGEQELIRRAGGMVWVTNPPARTVPFYQATDAAGTTALAADLLLGIGEVVGCGERHANKVKTLEALFEHGVEPTEYAWYLEMKRQYPMQTAGFGLGIERFLLWVLKHDDIRDMHIFTRLRHKQSAP